MKKEELHLPYTSSKQGRRPVWQNLTIISSQLVSYKQKQCSIFCFSPSLLFFTNEIVTYKACGFLMRGGEW